MTSCSEVNIVFAVPGWLVVVWAVLVGLAAAYIVWAGWKGGK